MDYESRINNFYELQENYITVLINLFNLLEMNNLLPFKISLGLPFIKEYILKERSTILEYSIKYILTNKEEILNFSIEQYEEIDDDNVSTKACIKKIKKDIGLDKEDTESNFLTNDILDIITQSKSNYKKMNKQTMELFKDYIKLLITILEVIKKIFVS